MSKSRKNNQNTELPRVQKNVDEFSPGRQQIASKIRKAMLHATVAGVGLLGTASGLSSSTLNTGTVPIVPQIINKKERGKTPQLVLRLQQDDNSLMMVAHRSHRSHSSHRSHYSHYSSRNTRPVSMSPTGPEPWAQPASYSVSGVDLESLISATVRITKVEEEEQFFEAKSEAGTSLKFYFNNEMQVRVLSPLENTVTLEVVKAFSSKTPLNVGTDTLVHWEEINSKKIAHQITISRLN